ncbi:hypothetical protein FRC07_002978, partial [Ceratobasidium sp. 392]
LSLEDNEMLSVVQGGIFTCGANTPRQSDGINRVKVVKLPSYESLQSSQPYSAITVSTGRYLSAFRTSAEQDLLVLGGLNQNGPCLTIHNLSGAPHPQAKSATLEFRTSRFLTFAAHDPQPIQIQGDLVSALLRSSRTGPDWVLVIWDWKTGELVLEKRGASHAISFTFLSHDSYMLVERDPSSAHLLVDHLDAQPGVTVPRFKLRLPELSVGWTYGTLHFRSDLPTPARDSYQPGQAFLPDPETGIIYLSIGLNGPPSASSPDGHMLHLGLFIGREALRRNLLALGGSSCDPVELGWSQWGEEVTRWIDMGAMPGLLATVHGSRCVQLVRQERSPKAWLQVLDFSPAAVCRNTPANESARSDLGRIYEDSSSYEQLNIILADANKRTSAGSVLVERYGYDRPTVLDMPGAFLHRVVSRLPYRCTTRIEPVDADSEWTIDGDLLFEIKVEHFSTRFLLLNSGMPETHTLSAASPTSTQLDLPPAFPMQPEQLAYLDDPKSRPSAHDQSQNKQGIEDITASPTFIKSTVGDHNVNQQALDPTSWPKWKKRRVLFIVCTFYFLFTFITTVTVPTFNDLQTYFGISYAQVNYTVAVPALALATSPFFWTPLAELLGRRSAMILGCLLAFCASVGVALERNYSGYMAFRFLQGWGVGPASTVGLQMLGEYLNILATSDQHSSLDPPRVEDIYLEHERGQKVGYWCLAIDIGLLFGPLIGGFAALVSWNFPSWLTVIIFGVLLVVMLLFLPETGYPVKISHYAVQHVDLPTSTPAPVKPLPWLNLRTLPGSNRPKPWDSTLHFLRLFAFPNVAITIMFYCWTWYWFILCVITMLPGAYPDYNPQVQGLLFLGFIVGTLISELLFSGGISDYLVRRAAAKNNGERIPEKRLLLYFPAALLTTIGLALFGCTVQFNWHWFVAQVATFLVGTGIQVGNTTTMAYIVDAYPQHVMDVTLFYSFHLNMSAFVSPFFIVPWYV